MTAPVLAYKKFYIVKPKTSTNQIKNPTFAAPDGVEDWTASGAGVTIESTGDEQRRGAYSMKVNTATGVASNAFCSGLSVTDKLTYTFSCDVKGTAGQAMRIYICHSSSPYTIRATKTFTATGYWQRQEVSWTATLTDANQWVVVSRDAVASTAPFYVDGAQFENAAKATTFIEGYERGCRWTGAARNSSSIRYALTRYGGELIDLDDYCDIVSVTGLGHGDWNQILTKMTSGGDMYQTHTRKSKQFSIVVDFIGATLGAIETNRKAIIDAIRPDLLEGQEMIVRYQGFDSSGVEATNPIDIVCVPMPATLVDTPDLPSHQRAVLNFMIPSGLLDGAYNDGAELDWVADFPAEHIVKRDKDGNWCEWGGAAYESLITGLNGDVRCMVEGPDGKIYVGGAFTNAGGVEAADYIARWDPISKAWEAVGAPAFADPGDGIYVFSIDFDASGNLYAGGAFLNAGGVENADYIAKFDGTNWTALGTGVVSASSFVSAVRVAPNGYIYIGGYFTSVSSVANTNYIAMWNGSAWVALATGLNNAVYSLEFAPNGNLYIGGAFTDAAYPYLCYWNGTAFAKVGATSLSADVRVLLFDDTGNLYIGGEFTNAGGVASADYIAKWNGASWSALGTGVNNITYGLYENSGKIYASGKFTTAGGLTVTDRVAIWSNGAWQPLDISLPGAGYVYSIIISSDGSFYIGGGFSTAGETPDENAECGIISDRVSEIGVASASANTYPFIQVHGPGTLKAITNYSTGKTIAFDGLTLQAGEWINLFFDPLNLQFKGGWPGRGNLMRYVVPGSDYGDFYLKPGYNSFSMYMTGSTTASGATITWKPRFWGIDGALL